MNLNNITEKDYKDIVHFITTFRTSHGYLKIPIDDAVSDVMEKLVRYPYRNDMNASELTYLHILTRTTFNLLFKLGKYKDTESISKFISDEELHEDLNFLIKEETELEYKPQIIIDYINDHKDSYKYLHKMIESGFNATYDDLMIHFNTNLQCVKNGLHNDRRRLKRRFNYKEMYL